MFDDPDGGSVFRHLLGRYPGQSAVLVGLLILAGLAEGFGVLTLVPLLEVVVAERPASGAAEEVVLGVLDALGLPPTLVVLLATLVMALWLKGLFRWVAMRRVGYGVARVARDLRLRLIRGLLEARWRHQGVDRSGELATALSRDAFWASYAYRHGVSAIAAGIQLVVYTGVVVLISWQVGVIAAAIAAGLAVVLGVFIGMSRRAGADRTRLARSLVSRLLDVIGGMKAIKAMGRERWFRPILEEQVEALEEAERRQVLATESLQAFQEPLLALVLALLVYVAVTRLEVAFATLLVAVFLFHRLLTRAHAAQAEYQGVAAAEAAFRALRRQTVAAEEERERRVEDPSPVPGLETGIEVRGVSVSYADRVALESVSLTIPARRMTVVVGPSGVGKTTLLDVLLGLRDPDEGQVRVDDVPLETLGPAAWRHRIGYVPQEAVLLDGTVARNVAFGEDVPAAALERALRRAGAWSFVEGLPQGVQTEVGERGRALSGGERQRIAIARALLHDPIVLVLDEATSELDAATEAAFCDTLRSLRDEITVVAASHRSALVDAADVTYELRAGRIHGGTEARPRAGPTDPP